MGYLEVHHIERDPDDLDEHDLANLQTFCRACHNWHHQIPAAADLPVELTAADERVLQHNDKAILRVIAADGPLTTGEIADALTIDQTHMAIRARLWVLMGLDNRVDERDRQIVDQDAVTGKWGLTGQIETSARGRIPDDPQLLLQRIEDERVYQAIERGCDRAQIAAVMDIHPRTTRYRQHRALAYDFPLDAIDGRGGRPPVTDDATDETSDGSAAESEDKTPTGDTSGDRPKTLTDGGRTRACASEPGSPDTGPGDGPANGTTGDARRDGASTELEAGAVHEHLQQALEALRAIEAAL